MEEVNNSAQNNDQTSSPGLDARHIFRQLIVQALYKSNFTANLDLDPDFENLVQPHEINLIEDLELSDRSSKVIKKLDKRTGEIDGIVEKIISQREALDNIIKRFAPEWPLDQINPVDLEILRLSLFEGFVEQSIPARVSINEAIELAREFGGETNAKFLSGVLGNVYNEFGDKKIF